MQQMVDIPADLIEHPGDLPASEDESEELIIDIPGSLTNKLKTALSALVDGEAEKSKDNITALCSTFKDVTDELERIKPNLSAEHLAAALSNKVSDIVASKRIAQKLSVLSVLMSDGLYEGLRQDASYIVATLAIVATSSFNDLSEPSCTDDELDNFVLDLVGTLDPSANRQSLNKVFKGLGYVRINRLLDKLSADELNQLIQNLYIDNLRKVSTCFTDCAKSKLDETSLGLFVVVRPRAARDSAETPENHESPITDHKEKLLQYAAAILSAVEVIEHDLSTIVRTDKNENYHCQLQALKDGLLGINRQISVGLVSDSTCNEQLLTNVETNLSTKFRAAHAAIPFSNKFKVILNKVENFFRGMLNLELAPDLEAANQVAEVMGHQDISHLDAFRNLIPVR